MDAEDQRRRTRFDRLPARTDRLEHGVQRGDQLPRPQMRIFPQLLLLQGAAGVGRCRHRGREPRALFHRPRDAAGLRRQRRRRFAAAQLRRGADRRSAHARGQRGRTPRAAPLPDRHRFHAEPALQPGSGARAADAQGSRSGAARHRRRRAGRSLRLLQALRGFSGRPPGNRAGDPAARPFPGPAVPPFAEALQAADRLPRRHR